MLLVICVRRFIELMLCLWVHISLHELVLVCVFIVLCVCACVHACMIPMRMWLCVHEFKRVCVVALLVSGTEPLLTVISLFMQCEKGLSGAWTPHALIPLRHSPQTDPHAPPPPFRHQLCSHHLRHLTQPLPNTVSRCPCFLSNFVSIQIISHTFCERQAKIHRKILPGTFFL